jgi:hypothetical protein
MGLCRIQENPPHEEGSSGEDEEADADV